MLIAQITDCHVVEPGGVMADRADPAEGLRRAVEAIERSEPRPEVVLATGDLVNDALAEQYDHFMELLAGLTIPVLPVVGNHDDRSELRRRFADVLPAGRPDEPVDYVVEGFPVRIVVLDTTIPGEHGGRVTETQMSWLDEVLAARPELPTLLVQHHPPFASGIEWMDRDCGFVGAELEEAVVRRHPQIQAIVGGHLHRSMHRRFGGTVASAWPSTAVQLGLRLDGGPVEYTDEPAGYALHHWSTSGGLVSHLVPVGTYQRWTPSWADEAPPPGS